MIRTTIFYPILDKALKELNERFSQQNMELLTGIDSFSPKSKQFLNFENLRPFAMQYKSNVADLEIEFKQLTRLINRKKTSNEFTAKTLLDILEFVRRYEDAFFETKRLQQLFIACSIPITSAEAERTFSCLKLIKTHLRTTMTDERLSSIAIISVHKDRAKKLDLDRVVDHFVEMYPHCRIALK